MSLKNFLIFFVGVMIAGFTCSKSTTRVPEDNPIIYKNSGYSPQDRAADLLERMTLEEKIGQMTQAERNAVSGSNDIREYYLGSILSGGGSAPSPNNVAGWADMYDAFQTQALQTRLGIPIIYGIDAVHGHNNVYGAVIFPHNIGMGCSGDPDLVERAARATAEEVAATGLNWTFAPCIAVPRDERWGRTYEGFSEMPDITRQMSAAAVKGFQGANLADPATILACAKHFAGDGGTEGGVDQGDTRCDEQTLREIHIAAYKDAIDAGVGSIMVSYNSWNGHKMHANKYLLTDVLKNEMKFEGILVSDWNAIDQLPGGFTSDVEQSINAGLDMIMIPDRYREFITTLKKLVNDGNVPQERIDDAVRRILTIKFKLGLFEHPYADRSLAANLGSEDHRQLARECVRKSMVLLKNDNNLLPLSKESIKIHVAGKNADDLGNQCGGWTISWQGSSGPITTGTTILEGIREVAGSTAQVTYSEDGSGADGADVGVVVIGETPYAEGKGDRNNLALETRDVQTIQRVKNAGIPVVVILVSGRPLIIDPVVNYYDALIAAWLPGSEGAGVADVLFGDYAPTGKLTHSWPKNMNQIPINADESAAQPLYPYGFGLTYEK